MFILLSSSSSFLFLFSDLNSYNQFIFSNLHFLKYIHLFSFFLCNCINVYQGCITKEAVKAHHLLVSKCLYSSTRSPYPLVLCEACRTSAQHQRAASGLRWNAKRRVNPVFTLTVSFDKVLSKLTYGNLVMTCLHTVISSAFHPYFLGLTIVPIMSVIVNVLHSLLCSNDRHMVVLFARVD